MFLKMKRLFPFFLLAVILASCSEYQKVLKNEDVKAKYDMAEKFYDEGDFKRANRLLEQIAPKYIGRPQGERVMFFLADSYFQTRDYNMAGYQFERFLKSYPKSDKAAEAGFLGAKSYYKLSPKYSLDQTDTDKALIKLQNFINAYPESEFLVEANIMAKELTTKKERKEFEIAKQFNTIGEFDYTFLTPAVTAFDNFIADNPGSVYQEDALYYKFDAATRLAFNSFEYLKKERFNTAKSHYNALKKQFPESNYLKDAIKTLEKIEKELQNYSK
ncbi:outer membrane protein assembly factor BamD [Arenibacter certesii]|uniref:Outer membrane protein assembly factor BamD n=2 Tax=Arenibacter certesii TaxID=228955 RepID=A0A918J383_9FLAO|nr:outer membrane protein assembly factor BamD [Arenibacter certesii]